MTLKKALVLGLGCALVDLVGAWLLDSLGFVEGLLAPSGAQLLVLIPAACAFYGARLITYFVLPALVLARLLSLGDRSAPALRSGPQESGNETPAGGLRAAANSAKYGW